MMKDSDFTTTNTQSRKERMVSEEYALYQKPEYPRKIRSITNILKKDIPKVKSQNNKHCIFKKKTFLNSDQEDSKREQGLSCKN